MISRFLATIVTTITVLGRPPYVMVSASVRKGS